MAYMKNIALHLYVLLRNGGICALSWFLFDSLEYDDPCSCTYQNFYKIFTSFNTIKFKNTKSILIVNIDIWVYLSTDSGQKYSSKDNLRKFTE